MTRDHINDGGLMGFTLLQSLGYSFHATLQVSSTPRALEQTNPEGAAFTACMRVCLSNMLEILCPF